jgi:hypothetical protein
MKQQVGLAAVCASAAGQLVPGATTVRYLLLKVQQ